MPLRHANFSFSVSFLYALGTVAENTTVPICVFGNLFSEKKSAGNDFVNFASDDRVARGATANGTDD